MFVFFISEEDVNTIYIGSNKNTNKKIKISVSEENKIYNKELSDNDIFNFIKNLFVENFPFYDKLKNKIHFEEKTLPVKIIFNNKRIKEKTECVLTTHIGFDNEEFLITLNFNYKNKFYHYNLKLHSKHRNFYKNDGFEKIVDFNLSGDFSIT